VNSYIEKQDEVVRSLQATKELAFCMKNALLLGEIEEFGLLLNGAWQSKKKFPQRYLTVISMSSTNWPDTTGR